VEENMNPIKDAKPDSETDNKREIAPPQIPFPAQSGSFGASANPFAITAYAAYQSVTLQKEPDPEVEKVRIEGLNKLGEQLHTQAMKQLGIEETRLGHLADIQKISDTRENRMAFGSFILIALIIAIGAILIFMKRSSEGIGILAGGMGTILGYLAGYGQGIKKRTF
jgi:hypothetical protein